MIITTGIQSIETESASVVAWAGEAGTSWNGHRSSRNVLYLGCVVLTLVYKFVKTHQNTYLKVVHYTSIKLIF